MVESQERNVHRRTPNTIIEECFRGRMLSQEIGTSTIASPSRFVEQAYFSLHLTKYPSGIRTADPVFAGLYSVGRPSQFIQGWVDGDYFDIVTFPDSGRFSLSEGGFDVQLFRMIGELVPPGGSLMVSYTLFSKESKIHKETKMGLDRGYPPVVTPLGYLLFLAGCGMGFKDWYFAEGGREGPEKLQGYKPIDSEVGKKKAELMLSELSRFISPQQGEDHLARECKLRADYVVEELKEILRKQ